MLEARNTSYHIGEKRILDGVSLRLEAGEVLAVVGPNGAGKSTLLKLLSGDLHPTQGDVLLKGKPIKHYPMRELALQRAVMSQRAEVVFDFTAYEVVMMGRYPHHRFGTGVRDHDHEIVREALHKTETEHLSERLYPTLSGGEAARVTLARVLAQRTPLLLLDEPTATLDLRHQQIVLQIVRELAQAGAGIVMILHDLNLAAAGADQVVMLHEGRLYAQGSPREVLTAAQIEAVFHLPVVVTEHPRLDCPLILPLTP